MRLCVTAPRVLAVVAVILSLTAPAFAAKDVQIAVVPVHAKPNAGFDASVTRLVDKPLRRQADVIPIAEFKRAAKRAHVKPMAVALPRNLKSLGKGVGATHILVIELTGRGRGATANTTLFDVHAGRTLLTDSYTLTGPKLTPDVASKILAPVIDAIGGKAEAGKDAAAADESADDAPKAKMGKGKGGFAFPGKGAKDGKDGEDAASDEEGADAAATAETGDDSEGANVEATAKTDHDPNDPHHTPLRIAIGATFMQRNAHINPTGGTGTAPCYCGTGNNSNPFFPAPEIALEFFPGVLHDGNADRWYDNVGLSVDYFFTKVNSYVDTNPNDTIGSTVSNFSIAATYRLNWWDSLTAPDAYFNIGYNVFYFPLTSGAFPGVAYDTPFISAQVHVPIIEQLTLMAGGSLMFATKAANDAGTALGTQSGGSGYNLNAGARVSIDRFELSALYKYQAYNASYTGSTTLLARGSTTTTVPVYQNVSLKDVLNEVTLLVGYRL